MQPSHLNPVASLLEERAHLLHEVATIEQTIFWLEREIRTIERAQPPGPIAVVKLVMAAASVATVLAVWSAS